MLQLVWSAAGGICGKYLKEWMSSWLDAMEAEGALPEAEHRYDPAVRAELEAMSAATIDRYLPRQPAADLDHDP